MLKRVIIFLVILFTFNSSFAASKKIYIGERAELYQIGLSLKLFRDMESRPATLPSTYKANVTLSNVYKSDEIWRYKQFLGKWANSYSDVTIAFMGTPASAINSSIITEGNAKGKFKTNSVSMNWTQKNTERWIKLYFGKEFSKKLISFKLSKNCSVEIYFAEDDQYKYFLSIITEKSRIKQDVAVLYRVDNTISKKDAGKAVFASLNSIKYIKIEDKNNVKYLNKAAYKSSKKDNSFSKELLLNNIKNYKDWSVIEASDYIIATNCDVKNTSDSFIKTVTETLKNGEFIYKFFNKEKTKSNDRFIVRIFKDRDDYIAYVGKALEWSGGVWMPSKKELVLTKSSFTSSERERFIKVLKHEAFHQYIHYATGGIAIGAWFNEGYAEFFENVSLTGRRIYIKADKAKIKYIKEHLNDPNLADNIEGLLKLSYKDFYAEGKAKYNYNLAWAIIYYLNTGTKVTWQKFKRNYSKILPVYYRELYNLKDNAKATRIAWKNINFKRFAKDFAWYYKTYVTAGKTNTVNL
jgi:hypothetical protein